MRQERTVQASIFDLFADHEIGHELKAMSQWLDEQRELSGWQRMICEGRRQGDRAEGLPAEAVLRCALLKQYRQLSYQELGFYLEDSASFRAFARLPLSWSPQKSVLQKTISAIRPESWEPINRVLLAARGRRNSRRQGRAVGQHGDLGIDARAERQQPALGCCARDGSPVEAGWRLGRRYPEWRDHRRAAKKRARKIQFTRGQPNRVQHYRELIKLTRVTLAFADQAAAALSHVPDPIMVAIWQAEFHHYRPLIERIIAQTERRVLHGEAVAASDKIVSLFEPHADIIVKGSRATEYGHKLNLTTGRSGMILDLVIEAGNPADSDRLLPMLQRHVAFYGQAPRQAAADGGFATRHNLATAKAWGVSDMAFHKKAGLRIEDMVRSKWVYRKLRNFRAGIEAGISCLKRAYGLARCTWRGLDHFKTYVWSSVVAYNLVLFARLKPGLTSRLRPMARKPRLIPGSAYHSDFQNFAAGSAHATATANEMAPQTAQIHRQRD